MFGSSGAIGRPVLKLVGVESKHVYARAQTQPQPTGERSALVMARRRNNVTPRLVLVSKTANRFTGRFVKTFVNMSMQFRAYDKNIIGKAMHFPYSEILHFLQANFRIETLWGV